MVPLLLALNTGLTVETSTPDALCPPLELVKEAVAGRLGSIELSEPWTLHYESVHREAGDYVRLELRGSSGGVRLQREFAGYGESCATLAQVMAVVVERYFRSFQAEEDPANGVPPPPLPPPSAPTSPSVTQAVELGVAVTSDTAVGPFVGYVWERPGASRALDFFSLALGVQPFPRRQAVFGGTAELTSASLELSVGPHWNWHRRLGLRLGPVLAFRVEHAVTHGLAVSSAGTRGVPALGLGATFTAQLSGLVGVALGATGEANAGFATSEFQVESRQIFELPALTASADLALRVVF